MMRIASLGLLVTFGLAAAVAQAATSAGVERALLTERDLGKPGAYIAITPPGWNQVRNQVTLDLCGFRFHSESLRVARRQLWFRTHTKPIVSNEVVAYRAGGAALAVSEVRSAVTHCPDGYVRSSVQGVGLVKNRIERITTTGLLADSIAYVDHITEQTSSKALKRYTVIAIFQERHGVLSGVYAVDMTHETLALRAARRSAAKLRAL